MGLPNIPTLSPDFCPKRISQKLARDYYGPFRILKRVGSVAYELDLLATARIYPVFRVSLLKACHGNPTLQVLPLPTLVVAAPEETVPMATLDRRVVSTEKGMKEELLVHWQGQDISEAT